MKPALQLESLDGVEKDLQEAYVETEDGQYVLDPDKYAEIKARGLVAKKKELLSEVKNLRAKLKDIDDDDLAALREKKNQATDEDEDEDFDDPRPQKTPENSYEELRRKWEKQRAIEKRKERQAREESENALKNEIAQLKAQMKQERKMTLLAEVGLKYGVLEQALKPWLKVTGDEFDLDERGRLVMLDEDGDPVETPVEEIVSKHLKERYPMFYASNGEGGGADSNQRRRVSPTSVQISRQKALDHSAYTAAKERAEKLGVPLELVD